MAKRKRKRIILIKKPVYTSGKIVDNYEEKVTQVYDKPFIFVKK
jgi:hypothetical protein